MFKASKEMIERQAEQSKNHADWADDEGNWIYGTMLENLDWSGIALPDADFNMFMAVYSNFDRAQLQRANFVHARLPYCSFRHADLTEADLYETEFDHSDFEGAKLMRADLTGASFIEGKCVGTNFTEAEAAANFHSADLRTATFVRANLAGAFFRDANVRDVDFRFANFGRINGLEGADIAGAILTGARIPVRSLAQVRNIEQVVADWIIISDQYSDRRLIGEQAQQWLRKQAALPLLPSRHPGHVERG